MTCYSRSDPSCSPADFTDPHSFHPAGNTDSPGLWISLGPIWLLASFLHRLAKSNPERVQGLRALIACSSSSVITKRFAANSFDRELVLRLKNAEDLLADTCQSLGVPCRIFRPTMIYGREGSYLDHNLTHIIKFMRLMAFLPVPDNSGLRQPIHATQLAAVILASVNHLVSGRWNSQQSECISLGGDTELSYVSMLRSIQSVLPEKDPARRCRLITVPSRLFYIATAPLMLKSPKAFEAVLRMSSNLSGFTPAHQLSNVEPQTFPVLPLI